MSLFHHFGNSIVILTTIIVITITTVIICFHYLNVVLPVPHVDDLVVLGPNLEEMDGERDDR